LESSAWLQQLSWQATYASKRIFPEAQAFVDYQDSEARQHDVSTFFSNMEGDFWQFNLFTDTAFAAQA